MISLLLCNRLSILIKVVGVHSTPSALPKKNTRVQVFVQSVVDVILKFKKNEFIYIVNKYDV